MRQTTTKYKIDQATKEEKEHQWGKAAAQFLDVGYTFKDEREYENAADIFMRAAVAFEREEEWRKIGHIWIECASALEHRHNKPVTDLFESIGNTNHFFPTLDRYAWGRFSYHEKVGRAYRNAAYHLEKCGANQTAYVQYRKAGDVFSEGGILPEASRSYYHGLLSYIEQHGEIDPEGFAALEAVNDELIVQNRGVYTKRRQLYYRALAAKLIQKGNYADSAKLFCKECDMSRRLAKEDLRYFSWFGYSFWKYTSYYGNSFWLWSAWAFILFVVLFPLIFRNSQILAWQEAGRNPTWFDYVYFSLATVTTAPDPSFLPSLFGKYVLTIESVVGFLMLGSLLVLLAKKIIR